MERILKHAEGLIFEQKKEFFEREKEERVSERRKAALFLAKRKEEEEGADVLGSKEKALTPLTENEEARARKRLGRLTKRHVRRVAPVTRERVVQMLDSCAESERSER